MRRKAGRSAKREYGVRLKQWQRRMRPRFLLAFLLPFTVLLALMLIAEGTPRVWIALLLGLWAGAGATMWLSPPWHIARLEVGSWGEEATEKKLKKLHQDGWFVVHDRQLGHGNLDHVAVSPAGQVFLLESKMLDGVVRVENGVLYQRRHEGNGRPEPWPNLPRSVSKRAVAIHDRLLAATGVWVWVYPVVVLWATSSQDAVPETATRETVAYVRGDVLARWLERQRERALGDGDRKRLVKWLSDLPAATWGSAAKDSAALPET
jgi:hypothetical protein